VLKEHIPSIHIYRKSRISTSLIVSRTLCSLANISLLFSDIALGVHVPLLFMRLCPNYYSVTTLVIMLSLPSYELYGQQNPFCRLKEICSATEMTEEKWMLTFNNAYNSEKGLKHPILVLNCVML